MILVEPDGARTILWGLDDALVPRPEQVRTDIVQSGRVLHLDGTGLEAAVAGARAARDAGLWVSLDVDRRVPGDEALLALCDIVVASEEIGWLDAPLSGVTLGERGAALRWPGGEAFCPAPAVEAVDTTGCGDVFRGALLAAALDGGDVKEVLRFACAAAALKTRRAGVGAGFPRRAVGGALLATALGQG
jgi:ribokinase